MSDIHDETARRIYFDDDGQGRTSPERIAAILREAFPDHIVDPNKMVPSCDSCGDPLDVDGDRSYHICAVCAESGCFPGTTRNPSPLIGVDAPGEATHLPWREALDIANAEIATLRAQLAEERAKRIKDVSILQSIVDAQQDAMRPAPDATALSEAAEIGRDYVAAALAEHDERYKHHPATEPERETIAADLAVIDSALLRSEPRVEEPR